MSASSEFRVGRYRDEPHRFGLGSKDRQREPIGRLGRLLQPTTNMPFRAQLLRNRRAVRVFFLGTANCKKTSMVGRFLILSYLTPRSKQLMIRGVPRAIAENVGQFLCSRKWVARMTRPNKRYKIGRYGSGMLSCLKTQRAIYILFNSVRIAKTAIRLQVLLEPRWKVTPSGGSGILVHHCDSDGLLVSLHGDVYRQRRLGTATRQPDTVHD